MKRIDFLKNVAIAASVVMIFALPYGCKSDDPEVRKFVVRFDSRGGSAVENQMVNEGEKVTKPADPTKANSTFVAWYKEVSLENEWDFDAETVQANTTLYAKWNTAEGFFTVTFQTSIGNMERTEVTVAEGARVAKPDDPAIDEDSGFIFVTWYTEAGFVNEWKFNTTAVTGDMTLYGKWIDPFEMMLVEHGKFIMGVTATTAENTFPLHEVTISKDFRMAKYLVTQIQYGAVMEIPNVEQYILQIMNARDIAQERGIGPDLPMNFVSWNDAQDFIARLNAATGKSYRLPTDAEWEFAARGGIETKGFIFPGSNNLEEVAWHGANSWGQFGNNPNTTGMHPVGLKKPNELGLYDMLGNALEWCEDYFSTTYYNEDPVTDPHGPEEPNDATETHVTRGSNWSSGPANVVIARRMSGPAGTGTETNGFRLASN